MDRLFSLRNEVQPLKVCLVLAYKGLVSAQQYTAICIPLFIARKLLRNCFIFFNKLMDFLLYFLNVIASRLNLIFNIMIGKFFELHDVANALLFQSIRPLLNIFEDALCTRSCLLGIQDFGNTFLVIASK